MQELEEKLGIPISDDEVSVIYVNPAPLLVLQRAEKVCFGVV
jgi:hypothetical protein